MIGFIGCVLACRKIPGKSARKDWRNNLELILILALTLVWCSRLSPGSPYRKEIKAVDRMSETPKQAFTKSIGTVSILLKAGDLLLFGSSSCTKSDTAGEFKRARPETALACAISPAPGSDTPESDSNARVTLRRWPYEINSPAVSKACQNQRPLR